MIKFAPFTSLPTVAPDDNKRRYQQSYDNIFGFPSMQRPMLAFKVVLLKIQAYSLRACHSHSMATAQLGLFHSFIPGTCYSINSHLSKLHI